jgi:glycerol-3-phosphate acyltransferase PlsX
VALLSIGEESSKGNAQVQAAHQLMRSQPLNFVGNVEGKDVFADLADVIVCDGFVGNVALKLIEGLAAGISGMLREELTSRWYRKLLAAGLRGAFRGLRKRMDYAEYGGAPLLGVNGVCVVAHGRSTPYAMQHALRVAAEAASHQVPARLAERVGAVAAEPQAVAAEPPAAQT